MSEFLVINNLVVFVYDFEFLLLAISPDDSEVVALFLETSTRWCVLCSVFNNEVDRAIPNEFFLLIFFLLFWIFNSHDLFEARHLVLVTGSSVAD